ncbi:hypothetical protein ES703_117061 [subsurface metagenome]
MSEHQAKPEDFELDKEYLPLMGKSLEQVIAEGESDWEKEQAQERISVNNMPQWVDSALINLKRKDNNVPSLASVGRLTAKLGTAVIRERFDEPITEVKRLRRRVFELINHFLLKKTYREGSTYELEETVGTVYKKCSLREWTAGAINDNLVDPLGLSSSTAVSLTLIAGISKSQTWVPKGWVQLANKELGHFGDYLDEEIKKLTTRMLGKG